MYYEIVYRRNQLYVLGAVITIQTMLFSAILTINPLLHNSNSLAYDLLTKLFKHIYCNDLQEKQKLDTDKLQEGLKKLDAVFQKFLT